MASMPWLLPIKGRYTAPVLDGWQTCRDRELLSYSGCGPVTRQPVLRAAGGLSSAAAPNPPLPSSFVAVCLQEDNKESSTPTLPPTTPYNAPRSLHPPGTCCHRRGRPGKWPQSQQSLPERPGAMLELIAPRFTICPAACSAVPVCRTRDQFSTTQFWRWATASAAALVEPAARQGFPASDLGRRPGPNVLACFAGTVHPNGAVGGANSKGGQLP